MVVAAQLAGLIPSQYEPFKLGGTREIGIGGKDFALAVPTLATTQYQARRVMRGLSPAGGMHLQPKQDRIIDGGSVS